jgi:hypothetical protein
MASVTVAPEAQAQPTPEREASPTLAAEPGH